MSGRTLGKCILLALLCLFSGLLTACSDSGEFAGSWRMDLEKIREVNSGELLRLDEYAGRGWIEIILDPDKGVYTSYSMASVSREVMDIQSRSSNSMVCILRRTSGDMPGTFRLLDEDHMTFIAHDARGGEAYYVRSPFAENLRTVHGSWVLDGDIWYDEGAYTPEEEERRNNILAITTIVIDTHNLTISFNRPDGNNQHQLEILDTFGPCIDVRFGNTTSGTLITVIDKDTITFSGREDVKMRVPLRRK